MADPHLSAPINGTEQRLDLLLAEMHALRQGLERVERALAQTTAALDAARHQAARPTRPPAPAARSPR